MKYIHAIILSLGLSAISSNAWSVKVYECEDQLGNRTFQDRCPPGTTRVNQKQYSTKTPSPSSARRSIGPLVLYLVPKCDTCDQVKEFLSVRNISFTEKNVNENIKLQEELKEKTGGDLRVPVLMIGNNAISGYNRGTLLAALEEAGYSDDQAQSGGATNTNTDVDTDTDTDTEFDTDFDTDFDDTDSDIDTE